MVAEGIDALGSVDVLVSNVAVRPHKPLLEVSVAEWQDVMATNLHAAFYLIRAVLPGMIERGSGSIIGLGGQSAITGRPDTAMVTTAKTGLLGLIRAVAAECALNTACGRTWSTPVQLIRPAPILNGIPSFRMLPVALTNICGASRWAGKVRCRILPTPACSTPATSPRILPATA